MLSLLRIAVRNLFVDRERGLLLFCVIASASAVLVGMMSLTAGVAREQRQAVRALLSGDLNVGGFFKVHPDTIAPVIGDAGGVRAVVEPLVPESCHLRERGRGSAIVGAGKHRSRSFMMSLDVKQEQGSLGLIPLEKGALEALDRPRTVALSVPLAERLRVQVGDVATLFAEMVGGKRNALDVEVVAITGRAGFLGEAAGILVSNATLRELSGFRPGAASVLQFMCGEGMELGSLDDSLRQGLRRAGFEVLPAVHEAYGDKVEPLLRENWAGQRLDVSTWEDESSFLSFVTDGLTALTALVGLIAIAVVMVGLFVSLSVSVRERTREVGTMRAMGMHRASVVGLFVLEGLVMGLLASAAGALAASLLGLLLRGSIPLPEQMAKIFFSDTLPLEPHLPGAVLAVLLVTLGAGLASIIPAARAAALPPRSAMESL